MMNNRDVRNNPVRNAIDAQLSGMRFDSEINSNVICAAREKRPKRKISAALVLLLVLVLVTVTAVAVTLLSSRQVVEQQAVPLAQQNDIEGTSDRFTNEELASIVKLAQENGITLSDDMMNALKGGQGYSEEEAIMALAKSEFGPEPAGWTLEQQYWFDETMVAIGFMPAASASLPGKDDISFDQAMAIVQAYILEEYHDDVSDAATWIRNATFERSIDEAGNTVAPPGWYFHFQPTTIEHSEYTITMASNGMIGDVIMQNLSEAQDGAAVIERYEVVYGEISSWTPGTWVALTTDLKGLYPGSSRAWAFQHAGYILPPTDGITEAKAREIALATVSLEHTTTSNAVCCLVNQSPIWKVETKTLRPEDIGSGRYTAIWLVEIDCLTGKVLDKQEFVVGGDVKPWIRWVPKSVFDELPPMPESPNG